MKSKQIGVVLITVPGKSKARQLVQTLLTERLIACANILSDVHSRFWWEGKQETANEILVFLKTRKDLYPVLEKRIRELHPYQVPEILFLPITEGNPAYLAWVFQETRKPGK